MTGWWKRSLVAVAVVGTMVMMFLSWSGVERDKRVFKPLTEITRVILHREQSKDPGLSLQSSQLKQLLMTINQETGDWHPNRVPQDNPDISFETDQGPMEIHLPRRKCLSETWIISEKGSARISEAGCKSLRALLDPILD